ncbi:hypothetical protein ACKAV7_011868 [Fusarium commune]
MAIQSMNTSSDPSQRQEVDSYDDKSFCKQHKGPCMGIKEPAEANDYPADETRGFNFSPFIIQPRDYHISYLRNTQLDLFQLFVPKSLLWWWIEYTSWIYYLLENGVVDSWNNPLHKHSTLLAWEGISTAQIDENAPLPKVFQATEEWYDHIQRVSAALFQPGSHLAVDECMVRYTGRSTATTVVKGKPTPLGFKIWVIAQAGFIIRWLWHFKGSNYDALDRGPRRKRGRPSTQEREAASKEASALIQLGNTRGVVISLCDMLPKQAYHVFVDNLFSTPPLFRKLRDHG